MNRKYKFHVYRLLFVSHSSNLGGAERSLVEIVNNLSYCNIDVAIVLPCKGEIETLLNKSIKIYYCELYWWLEFDKKYSLKDKLWIFRQFINSIGRAKEILNDFNPTIVVTNTSVIPTFAIAAKIEGILHCWFVRELVEDTLKSKFLLGNKISFFFINMLSTIIYVNSEYLKIQLSKYISLNKINIVRQYVEIKSFSQLIFSKSNILNILMVGSISPHKKQHIAVQACNKLNKKGVTNILTLVGDNQSEYCISMKQNISDNVVILPFLDDVSSLYKKADIVIVCSCETLGRVTIEAMKYSIPVVAANVGASQYLIKDGKTGLLFENDNVDSLVEKLERLQYQYTREQIGCAACLYANETFSKNNMLFDIMEPLETILNKRIL